MFDRVLNIPLAALLLASGMEPCKPASRIEDITPLPRDDRL